MKHKTTLIAVALLIGFGVYVYQKSLFNQPVKTPMSEITTTKQQYKDCLTVENFSDIKNTLKRLSADRIRLNKNVFLQTISYLKKDTLVFLNKERNVIGSMIYKEGQIHVLASAEDKKQNEADKKAIEKGFCAFVKKLSDRRKSSQEKQFLEIKPPSMVGKWESEVLESEMGPLKHQLVVHKDHRFQLEIFFSASKTPFVAKGSHSVEGVYNIKDSYLLSKEMNKGKPVFVKFGSDENTLFVDTNKNIPIKLTRIISHLGDLNYVFDSAVTGYGEDYLKAESALLGGAESAKTVLQMNLNHPDPVARLTADCLLRWMQGKASEYQAVLTYLEDMPKHLAMTPITAPRVEIMAYELSEQFGTRVADFLSLRLLKGTDWPNWKIFGVLVYLQEQAQPSTTIPLMRFAAESTDSRRRAIAITAIHAIDDPDIKAKLVAERQHAKQQGKTLPSELEALHR